MKEGQIFGYYSFFTGDTREINAKSIGSCTVLSIDRDKFLELVNKEKFDLEKFCTIRDRLIFDKTSALLNFRCEICNKIGHFVDCCPDIHMQIFI